METAGRRRRSTGGLRRRALPHTPSSLPTPTSEASFKSVDRSGSEKVHTNIRLLCPRRRLRLRSKEWILLALKVEIGNLLPNHRRQRRTCYALCHILYPVSAAHTSIFRMDSNSTSYLSLKVHTCPTCLPPQNFEASLKRMDPSGSESTCIYPTSLSTQASDPLLYRGISLTKCAHSENGQLFVPKFENVLVKRSGACSYVDG